MPALRIVRYLSAESLRAARAPWDDLWRRSPGVLPNARANFIADYLELLAPQSKFVAIGIACDGQLVAALPLVEQKFKRFFKVGSLPSNDWCWAGDLMLDLSADRSAVLAALVSEIRRLPWHLLWFNTVPVETPRWQELLAELAEANVPFAQQERFRIGTVEIEQQMHRDWDAYEMAWSGNHRRHMRKALHRADDCGGVELETYRPHPAHDLEMRLREGFEVEHRSWKGDSGSSVLADRTAWNFYLRQAGELATAGHLELNFLRHRGQAIAFEYGWNANGVYYSPKVGFDNEFARFSPGQLLRYLLLKRVCAETDCDTVDFLGPLSEATAKWATTTYPISRLAICTDSTIGRQLLRTRETLLRPIRNLVSARGSSEDLKIVQLPNEIGAPLSSIAIET